VASVSQGFNASAAALPTAPVSVKGWPVPRYPLSPLRRP
jgi:hypothetical protein